VYAWHVEDPDLVRGREPFGPEGFDLAQPKSSRPKGLWGVSPLYVNPVNMLNILTKVSRLCQAGGVLVREGLKEALSGMTNQWLKEQGLV